MGGDRSGVSGGISSFGSEQALNTKGGTEEDLGRRAQKDIYPDE